MTLVTTSTMIFIGNQPIIDVDETDGDYENAAALSGSYDDLEMVDITNYDVGEDGVIWSDEVGSGDYIEYTIDGVTYSSPQDAIVLYNAIITERDGTVHTVEVSVIQTPNGDTFVNDMGNAGSTDNLNIKTIELVNPTSTSSGGRNTFATTENTSVCFGTGALITTPEGQKPVQTLRTGDLVVTLGGGVEAIKWIGVSQFPLLERQAPVTLRAGALGHGYPSQDLVLSPQHRVLIASKIARRMFDHNCVFVSARNLAGLPGVHLGKTRADIEYWHILCRRHTVLFANDLPVESLFPGPVARRTLPQAALERVAAITKNTPHSFDRPCFTVPSGPLQRQLIERHVKNNKPCMTDAEALSLNAGIGPLARQNTLEPARLVQ